MESKKIVGHWHYGILLTYAAFTLGVLSIFFSIMGRPGAAVVCILYAGLCDSLDGIVARTRKNRTDDDNIFGIQIDSLSDLVAFGVAPVMVGYSMGMRAWYYWIVYCLYALCALVRLAYFNVSELKRQNVGMNTPKTGEPVGLRKYYEGMPVTQISLIIPIFYFVATMFESFVVTQIIMVVLYVVYAVLMVVRIKIPKSHGAGLAIMIVVFLSAITASFLIRWFVCGVTML